MRHIVVEGVGGGVGSAGCQFAVQQILYKLINLATCNNWAEAESARARVK